ncbi:MAG: cysteine--tRNA ligase [Pseudomonadota bacterium]
MLMIYNSKSKQKEHFKPHKPGEVNLYVCGMTVYDYCHIGHARSFTAFDVIYRFLQFYGFKVNYIRNITDIDDKIIKRSDENKQPIDTLTASMIDAMHEDFARLGMLSPSEEPRATQYIDDMIVMIQTLVDKGFAYQGKDGDVYYDVSRFDNYGQLSHRKLEDLRAGERIAVASDKEDPLDFVLWKMAKPNEPSWASPWGSGRPGWHLECSVMSIKCLHNQVDIHGGGMDLLFPHHENEVAQSEAATGKPFVNIWMHTGFLQINEEKMSKSLGNFFTIRDVLADYAPESVRYFLMTTHYRSPLNYSTQGITEAHAGLERLYNALMDFDEAREPLADSDFEKSFVAAMCDDFNVPLALSVLFDLVKTINRHKQEQPELAATHAALLRYLGGVLGILQQDPAEFFKKGLSGKASDLTATEIEQLIARRDQARADKNWAEADRIRDQLAARQIILEDKAGKTIWRKR